MSNNVFSCKCISSLTIRHSNFKLKSCIGHMIKRVLGNISCDLDPKVKVKGQIIYFLVNVSPPKPLEVATSNFYSCICNQC